MILIDADILIDLFRGYPPAIQWFNSLDEQAVRVPGFVAMQLLEGCLNKQAEQRTYRLLDDYELIWPTEKDYSRAVAGYGDRRLKFGLDVIDALIAEIAIGVGAPLYTFNLKHFVAFEQLSTVQPYPKN
ncbi:MAG TPA: PIN domain-containing protein [Tepidisphaeraceae bacterium]|nr:PIN domain-containing protein [Tepidisphaeraceae bacterium]